MRLAKHRLHARHASRALIAAFVATPLIHAADFYKADNESALSTIAAWVNSDGTPVAAAPTNTANTDQWFWDSRVTSTTHTDGTQNVLLGNNLWTKNLTFGNIGVPVIITGTASLSLTINTGGAIDMSAATQDVTFQTFNTGSNVGIRLSANGNYTFSVAAGRTLTFTSAKIAVRNGTSNSVVIFPGPGKVVFNDQFQSSHASITGGRVEFNCLTGSTRIATASPNPVSYTDINGGVVMVNNTSGSATGDSIVNINATGTLGGTGKITGSTNSVVNANSGSTLAPGNDGVGTLSIGKLNLASGSTIVWEANNSTDSDRIAVTGTDGLVINGGTIKLYQPGTTTPFAGTGVFTLFTQVGAIGGLGVSALAIDEATKVSGHSYTLAQGAGVVTLAISDGSIIARDWVNDASGTWSTASNWTDATVPDGTSAIARIPGATGATLTAPRTVTLDSSRTINSLVLDGTQAVTLDGSSTLTLDAGGAAASLSSSGANHAISTPIALTTGGAVTTVEGAGNTLTLSNVVSGTDVGLVKAGNGTLLLTANNTYTGATSVTAGILQVGDGASSGSVGGALSVSSGSSIRFNRADPVTLAAAISGTGNVAFNGAGQTTLSVANTHTGTTTIGAGSLVLAHADALKSTTLNYAATGGSLTVADPIAAINLGGLTGDRAFPLTNSLGTAIALSVGANGGSTTYSGSPLGTGATFTKTGSGTLTLTGTHVYSGNTTVNAGVLSLDPGANFTTTSANTATGATARIVVNGGTLNASGASTISNATAGLLVSGGTANFTGGIANETASSSGNVSISVTGNGTLNASSITLSRGGLSITPTEPTGGQTANGLYINGGAVNVTGALGIGSITGANSSVSARMDAGSLTVGGAFTVGINNTTRWSVLDINGGTLTVNDTTNGLLLGSPFAGEVTMLIRKSGAVVKVPRVQFGQAALAGKSYLNLSAGSLYVGAGGLVLGSTAPSGLDPAVGQFDAALRLSGGALGASADWSSTVPVALSGTSATVTGLDEADLPHTITLSGAVSGGGDLTKTGAGTVRFTNSSNVFGGNVTISGGTLGVAGTVSLILTVNSGGTLAPEGVLITSFGANIDGQLSVGYNAAATTPVSRIESPFDVVLGASSSLTVSGTGNLPGPAYPIIKGTVSGTFATVSLPAGFTLNYAYDDDNDAGTPTVVAIVGASIVSPYDTWTASYSLTGSDALASADPDGDGFANLLEFAFSSSPVVANAAPWTIGRSGDFLTLSFNHPADSGLIYEVEATSDLAGTWTTVHTFPTFTSAAVATYTDTVSLTAGTRRFLRLKISAAP